MDAKSIVEDYVNQTQNALELDGILAESNKLSKDIGEMMKNGEKSKAAILKENSFK
jgi:seryl-tRNA synthetase